jgi:metal-sulfur cluster biosynthetic enzyme
MTTLNISTEQVLEALSEIEDPELKVNIVDLGLIYKVTIIEDKSRIEVDMTLTSIGCPIGPSLLMAVQNRCLAIEGVKDAFVNIVFDPPWNPRIHATEEGKMELGIVDY